MPGMAPCLLLGELESIYKPPFPPPLLCSPGTGRHSLSCCLQSTASTRVFHNHQVTRVGKELQNPQIQLLNTQHSLWMDTHLMCVMHRLSHLHSGWVLLSLFPTHGLAR